MVRTRSQSVFIQRQNIDSDIFAEIREKAIHRRPIDPRQSPRKRSISKQKRKDKRHSMEFAKLLSNKKENLSKVSKISFL